MTTTNTMCKLRLDIPKRLLMLVDANALDNRDQRHVLKSYMFSEQVTFKAFTDVFFDLNPYGTETKRKEFELSRQFRNTSLGVENEWLKSTDAKVRKLYKAQTGYDEIGVRVRDATNYTGILVDENDRLWVLTKDEAARLVDNEVIDFGRTSKSIIAEMFIYLSQMPSIIYDYVFNFMTAPRYLCDCRGENWFPIMTCVTTGEFVERVRLYRNTPYNRRIYKGCWDVALQRGWKSLQTKTGGNRS